MKTDARWADHCSDDDFLGGRLKLLQPRAGYRAGLDAVMLAACVPAQPGDQVLEAGIGTGVAALCLAARADGATLTGVEINSDIAAIAVENAQRNGLGRRVQVVLGDVTGTPAALSETIADNHFQHAMANPPFYLEGTMRAPDNEARRIAHMRREGELDLWVKFMAAKVRPGGSLTFILPADALAEIHAALARRAGDIVIFPLFPRSGASAHRIIVQARKGARGASRLLQGLVLHGAGNAFLPETESILRDGAALTLRGGGNVPI